MTSPPRSGHGLSGILWRISLSGLLLLSVLLTDSQAQMTLDGSLGPRTALTGPNYLIPADVGQIRGPNLFHSFGQFNLFRGESATFTGPNTIANIIGRVTGGSPSSIDGTIRSRIPGANLYLLNPNGVMFGPNATLEVSGSFHVSTADYLRLADEAHFSAHLSDTSLLTVAPPAAFGFLGLTPAPISVSGSTLEVPEGQTLSFIGGDLMVAPFLSSPPTLRASGGRITLVSVASAGEVGFHPTEPLRPPEMHAFTSLGQIMLSGDATLTASGTSGGTIVIRGGHLMIDFSTVASVTRGDIDGAETGIDIGVAGDAVITNQTAVGTATRGAGRAGAVRLTAGSLEVSHDATLSTQTFPGSTGLGGDMHIEVGQLTLTGDGRIVSLTQGAKQAGTVTVTARDTIRIAGGLSGIITRTESEGAAGRLTIAAPNLVLEDGGTIVASTTGTGPAGDISVEVGQLTLSGGAAIDSNAEGRGPGGTVTVTAHDTIRITGRGRAVLPSRIASSTTNEGAAGRLSITAPSVVLEDRGVITVGTGPTGTGRAGDISIEVGQLTLSGGATIGSHTSVPGAGGTVTMTARDLIRIAGRDSAGFPSRIASSTTNEGAAGSVAIVAPSLVLEDGGTITAGTTGTGRAGDISIEVGQLTLSGGAAIDSSTVGLGPGGTVTVTAHHTIRIVGRGHDRAGLPSSLRSVAGEEGTAGAGRLAIAAPTLSLEDGGSLSVATTGPGRAGDIRLEVGQLTLSGGAVINSSTSGPGAGGTVTVMAREAIHIAGRDSSNVVPSGIYSATTTGLGQGGDITLQALRVELADGATISAESTGPGNAGNVTINAGDAFLSTNSRVTTLATQADGGNIQITAPNFLRLRDSRITAEVGGGPQTVGGNVTIDPQFVLLQNSQIVANAFTGHGGNLRISAQQVFLRDPSSQVSASSMNPEPQFQGTVDIRAPVTSISGTVAPLPQSFARAAELLRDRCAERLRGGSVSRFVLGGRDGVPQEPGGMWPSPLGPGGQETAATPGAEPHATGLTSIGVLSLDQAGQSQIRRWHVQALPPGWELECVRWMGK